MSSDYVANLAATLSCSISQWHHYTLAWFVTGVNATLGLSLQGRAPTK